MDVIFVVMIMFEDIKFPQIILSVLISACLLNADTWTFK